MSDTLRTILTSMPEASLAALASDREGSLKETLISLIHLVESQGSLIADQQKVLVSMVEDEAVIQTYEGRQEVLETHLAMMQQGKALIGKGEEQRGEVVKFASFASRRRRKSAEKERTGMTSMVIPLLPGAYTEGPTVQ